MEKILICICFHYTEDGVQYLKDVLNNCLSYPMDVDIIIDTNEDNEIAYQFREFHNIAVAYHTKLEHPYHLTWQHRVHMAELIDEYDYFMYLEHDMLVPYQNFVEYTKNFKLLYHKGFVPSFIRVEGANSKQYVTDLLGPQNDVFSVNIDGKVFANLTQPYHAFWIMPQGELHDAIKSVENIFKTPFYAPDAINRELAASFPMWQLGKVPLVLLDGDRISPLCYSYHTTNNYAKDSNHPHAKIELDNLIIKAKKSEMEKIEQNFKIHTETPSDINEHLPTIYEYAKKCDHVTEMGVRWVSSSWALLRANPKKIVSYDILKDPNVQQLVDASAEYGINFHFIEQDVLKADIEQTDMLFIDTWHTYKQLFAELNLHAGKVRKYILFHDTVSFALVDEGTYDCLSDIALAMKSEKQGLVAAINDFLLTEEGQKWEIERVYANNNGLTIMRRKELANKEEDIVQRLDYLKRLLTDTIFNDAVYEEFFNTKQFPPKYIMDYVNRTPVPEPYLSGNHHGARMHTMIGIKRLNNVHECLDNIRLNNIKGDIIETGVWRGGCCIFIKAYLDWYGMDRKLFIADSFEGLPYPNVEKYPVDEGDTHHQVNYLRVSLEAVKGNFERYDVSMDNVTFLKGWFENTLANNDEIKELAILRFDGDMYGSTMDVLNNLYDKVVKDGVIIIDDYCLPNCVKAVTDFRNQMGITEELTKVDDCGVWWTKTKI